MRPVPLCALLVGGGAEGSRRPAGGAADPAASARWQSPSRGVRESLGQGAEPARQRHRALSVWSSLPPQGSLLGDLLTVCG